MSFKPRIEIKTVNGLSGAFTEIYVDGNKLNGVRRYSLNHCAGELPVLTVDLNALDITIDTDGIMVHETLGEIEEIKFKKD